MDIKKKIEELVERIKTDKALQAQFKADPAKAVESLLGVKIPGEQVEKLVEGISAKLKLDKLGSALGGLFK